MSHYIRDRKQVNRMEKLNIWAVGSVLALSGLALAVAHRFTIEAHASMPTPFALGTALDRAEVTLADGRALSLHDGALSLAGKRIALSSPRRFASLTVMPTGQVLVWGGIDDEGRLIETGEWFEPSTGALVSTGRLGLPPRAGHTLNVMSDGTLAMTGGWGVGNVPAHDVALWRPLDRHLDLLAGDTAHVRLKSEASLLADGTLQITGGVDEIGRPVHEAWRFGRADSVAASKPHGVAASYPTRDNGGASPIGPLALRFSEPVDVAQLDGTVSLLGPNGVVKTRVVGAEDGRLAFVQLPDELYPAARYTIFVQGLRTAKGDAVPYEAIGFTTKAARSGVVLAGEGQRPGTKAPESSEPPVFVMAGAGKAVPCKPADAFHLCRDKGQVKDGAFYPGQDNVATSSGGHWRLYKDRQTLPDTKQLEANLPKGSTALIGQVRRIDESPVANVEISVDGQKVRTDGQGVFVLQHLLAGRRELFVDGRPAGSANTEYGRFIVGADVAASTVNHMPFVMYLPRVLERDKIALPSPTTRETVLTHPDMPGLELRIPAGAVFKDRDGKVLNEIAIVPTPVDHAPFPLPDNFPMYFTIQPGDAVVQGMTPEAAKGIQVVYPNYGKQKPADKADFWVYSAEKGWEMYGAGHVSADASQLVADKDTRLVWALGAGASTNPPEPDDGKKPNNKCDGDPVDLQTGHFFRRWTDLSITDTLPIAVDRTTNGIYNPASPFGLGSGTSLAMTLSSSDGFLRPKIVLSCGEAIYFDLASGQAVWPLVGTVWKHRSTSSPYYGATLQFLNDSTPEGAHWVMTMPDGSAYWFDRHAPNKLASYSDVFGNTIKYGYDSGLLTRITSPNGRSINLTYNSQNLITKVSDSMGRSVMYHYHRLQVPTGSIDGWLLDKATYPDGTSETYSYAGTADGLPFESWYVRSILDRGGHTQVSNQFDTKMRVTQQTFADGGVMSFAYETSGDLVTATTVTDQAGNAQRTVFDGASGYPSSETKGMGTDLAATVYYVRDSAGRPVSEKDPLGREATYRYDESGNIISLTRSSPDGLTASWRYTYVDSGHMTSMTNPLGQVVHFEYKDGCQSAITDPSGAVTKIECDTNGRMRSFTDPTGKVTRFDYVGGDLIAMTNPAGEKTTYVYDVIGRRVAAAFPNGDVVRASYDVNDRVIEITDGLGSATHRNFDGLGNESAVTLPNGSEITFSYDSAGRRIQAVDSYGKTESWVYDHAGHVTSYEDRAGRSTSFGYDVLGRRIKETFSDGTVITRTYDAVDRPLAVNDSEWGLVKWSYDGFGRTTREESPSGVVSYSHDIAGRRTSLSVEGQETVSYEYDGMNRLSKISRGTDEVLLAYDPAGRRRSLLLPNGVAASYTYDQAGRKADIIYHSGASGEVLADFHYSYDTNGRRVVKRDSMNGSFLPSPSVNDATFDKSNRVLVADGRAFAYDGNGNLTSDGVQSYVWNARDQLVEVKRGSQTVLSFMYDAIGRRIAKSGDSIKSYTYDGKNVAAESVGNNVYSFLNSLTVDERFSRGSGPDESFYIVDALGSTTALTDRNGQVTARFGYSPYGSSDVSPGPHDNQYMFTGREYDLDDLYFYRARYYQPSTGRFLSEDPLGFDSDRINFYGYVGGDPVSRIDPLGLKDYRDQCVGRYASCSASQDPNGSTAGNWLRWKGCKAAFDWGIKSGETAGTQIACEADRTDCTGSRVNGELDENDPLAIKCNNEFRKCMVTAGKKQ